MSARVAMVAVIDVEIASFCWMGWAPICIVAEERTDKQRHHNK
jgi:hypothetical protein